MAGTRQAVCSLLHFPSRFRAWVLPSTLPYGVRTFLPGRKGRSDRPCDTDDTEIIRTGGMHGSHPRGSAYHGARRRLVVLGRHHPLVRRIRALGRSRRDRDSEGVFVAEGLHLAQEAIACGAAVEIALVSSRIDATTEGREILRGFERAGIPWEETPEALLESLQEAASGQPVLLVARQVDRTVDAMTASGETKSLLAVSHGVQDPGNLGSLMRSAAAAAATGFVTTGEGADLYHPRAVRASAGAVFRLPATRASLDETLRTLSDRGIRTVGTDPSVGVPYDAYDWKPPTAVMLGREGSGLSDSVLAELHATVRIPMQRGIESLSVAAAGAVLLFEAARQRRR